MLLLCYLFNVFVLCFCCLDTSAGLMDNSTSSQSNSSTWATSYFNDNKGYNNVQFNLATSYESQYCILAVCDAFFKIFILLDILILT